MTDQTINRRHMFTATALAGAALAASPALVPVASAQTAADSTLDRIRKNGVLRMGVITGQEPYFHKDLATDKWSGACVEMGYDIASKLSAKVETLETTWGNAILDLRADKIDVAFAMNPTPERALVTDFTTPIFVHTFTLVTRKGFPHPATWEDINKPEVKIAVDIGSSHEFIARRYAGKATILGFKTRDEAVLAVATGRADCEVVLTVLAVSTLKKNPALGELVVPRPMLTLPTNMAIRYEADRRFCNFLSVWADYNRSMGQTREWMIKGFADLGIKPEDIPAEVQF